MSYYIDRFKSSAKNIFDRNKVELGQFKDFDQLFENLNEQNKNDLCYLSVVYEWSCEPQNSKTSSDDGWVRDDFRLISTIAIIERLMENQNYLPFHVWLEDKIETLPSEDAKKAYKKLFKDYNEEFGLAHKVKNFFFKYLTSDEQKKFLDDIEIIEADKTNRKFNNFYDFGGLLYSLRSSFVHSAKLIGFFCPPHCDFGGFSHQNKHYISKIYIDSYLGIFEKIFTRYWVETSAKSV